MNQRLNVYRFYYGDSRPATAAIIGDAIRSEFPGGTTFNGLGEWNGVTEFSQVYVWITGAVDINIDVPGALKRIASEYNQESIAWTREVVEGAGFGPTAYACGEPLGGGRECTEDGIECGHRGEQ